MQHTTSADGTRIAYDRTGVGDHVVIIGGAFSTSAAARPLAAELAEHGLAGVVFDRRARGESGDTRPYAPEREVEDLQAVIGVVGGVAAVLGHSSGAVLALIAAAAGVPVGRLFLSEPPFHFGVDEPDADLPDRLQALVDRGRPGDAVTTFQREGVGLPEAMIEQIRTSPMFGELVALAQSTVYDARLTADASTPSAAMTAVTAPVSILRGEETFPILVAAADRLAHAMPSAELVIVPESRNHAVDPPATARVVADRLIRNGTAGP